MDNTVVYIQCENVHKTIKLLEPLQIQYASSAPMNDEASFPAVSASAVPDIDAIEVDHQKWIATQGKEGKRASFRGFNLSGADLSGRKLVEASFRGVNLTGANLSGADLRTADMSEAVLDKANLTGTLLSGASLAGAQMRQANAQDVDLVTANLTGAIAEEAVLTGGKLSGAILRDANFRKANLSGVVLRDANLRGAILQEADLKNADLNGADCRDANCEQAGFAGALLKGANFRGAKLTAVDLSAADFSEAIDVPSEIKAQSMQTERSKMQEEQAQIQAKHIELQAREEECAAEKNRVAKLYEEVVALRGQYAQMARMLNGYSRGFIVRFVLWFLVGATITLGTIMRAIQMEVSTIIGVLGFLACLIVLAFFSMLRSLQTAQIIKAVVSSAGIPDASSMLEESTRTEELPTPSETVKPKKTSGFGKKR